MPATVSKPIPRLFSPILIFFADPASSCRSYRKCKSIMHFFFIWLPVAVNILCFQVHAIDGLGGGGYRKNTRKEYMMIVRYGFSRFTRVFFLRTKDETATYFSKYLAEIAPRKVEVVRSDGAASFRKVLLMPLHNRENQARIYDSRFPTIQRRC